MRRATIFCIVAIVALGLVGVTAAETDDEPEIEVSNVSTDLQPGSSTELTFTVTNVGNATAVDAESTVNAGGGVVIDGGVASDILGNISAGESTVVTVTATAGLEVSPGDKSLSVTITYEDEDGEGTVFTSDNLTVPVYERQNFTITELEDTLAVGYDGVISGEVRNDGPHTLEDGVLAIHPGTTSMYVQDNAYALPTLEPGETASFEYPTDVDGQADAGARQAQFVIEYSSEAGDSLEAGPVTERVTIDEQLVEFDLAAAYNDTLEAGTTQEYQLNVTNTLPETVSHVNGQLYTDGDVDAEDREGYIEELAPNETGQMTFVLSTGEETTPGDHPIDVQFDFDDERGYNVLTGTYTHGVEVVPSEDDDEELPTAALGAAVIAVGALSGGFLWWRRGVTGADAGAGGE